MKRKMKNSTQGLKKVNEKRKMYSNSISK